MKIYKRCTRVFALVLLLLFAGHSIGTVASAKDNEFAPLVDHLKTQYKAKKRGIPLLFITGYPPDNAHELAIGCLLKPYNDRAMRKAIEAIDQHLGGKTAKSPKGLELYPIAKGEAEA